MPDSSAAGTSAPRLVILLNNVSTDAPDALSIPLRYAATAAAMDVAVEMHAVSRSVALLRRDAVSPALLAQLQQAVELGVQIFACPVALAEQGMRAEDLSDAVAGVRGAASLLVSGLGPDARFMVF